MLQVKQQLYVLSNRARSAFQPNIGCLWALARGLLA